MKLSLIVGSLLLSFIGFSQNTKQEKMAVRAVIDQFFEGMRLGDSAMVKKTVHPDVDLYTTYFDRNKQAQVASDNIESFLESIATQREEKWDERISNVEIKIEDNLATAWMDYTFYLDDFQSHSGVNAFQLVKLNGNWLILHITDTRRMGK